MKNTLTLLISVIIVLVLVAYTFCFQVRYDQVAIVTTFDKATNPRYAPDGTLISAGSLCLDPGLYVKWPWPVQSVTVYDKRLQMMQGQLEEFQTSDHYAVIIDMYVTWHVDNPLDFFVKLQNFNKAEETLTPLVRDLKSLISQHRFDELVNIDASKLQFDPIEQECQKMLQQRVTAQGYGIKIDRVGIRKVVLPETVTQKVFDRMKKNREALAQQARSEGDSQATAIKSEATAAKDRILAFADSRALAIRTEGDKEAAEQYKAFAINEKLAIFLRQIETLKKILPHNTTFILAADQIDALKLLGAEPGAIKSNTAGSAQPTVAPNTSAETK